MSWDPAWERVFSQREWGRYPPEELIRFVARHFFRAPDRSQVRILELGCGAGANLWFLAREGFAAYGMDGAPSAIRKAERRLAEDGLRADLRVGDAAQVGALYPAGAFDAVIDVCCLQHNPVPVVGRTLTQVRSLLRPGGWFFAMLVAAGSWGAGTGIEVEPGTFTDIAVGPLVGVGLTHFFTETEVESLLAGFDPVEVESSERSLNRRRDVYRHWVVEGQVP